MQYRYIGICIYMCIYVCIDMLYTLACMFMSRCVEDVQYTCINVQTCVFVCFVAPRRFRILIDVGIGQRPQSGIPNDWLGLCTCPLPQESQRELEFGRPGYSHRAERYTSRAFSEGPRTNTKDSTYPKPS